MMHPKYPACKRRRYFSRESVQNIGRRYLLLLLTRFENWRKMGSFGFLKGQKKKKNKNKRTKDYNVHMA
jgi:hypothetical protein